MVFGRIIHFADSIDIDSFNRAYLQEPRIIETHLTPAKSPDSRGEQVFRKRPLPELTWDYNRVPREFADQAIKLLFRSEDEAPAGFRQRLGDPGSDSAGCTGNDRNAMRT